MKTLLSIFSLLALTSFAGHANQAPFDYCNKLPGKWHAATHIKDHSSCDAFNGCEHFDLVTFKQTEIDNYTAMLYFSNDGTNITVQSFSFICAANQFHFKNQEDKTVNLKCDEYNNCYMVVDTPLFTVELVKQ